MTETKTPSPASSPIKGTPSPTPVAPGGSQITIGKPENPQSVFVGMALDMSWRLALVVLVPIIGGYEIDSHTGATPLLTILGFLVAIAGVIVVMRQTVRAANNMPAATTVAPQEKRR